MFSLIKKIFGSKEEKAVIKELSEEQKDLKEMEAALKKFKSSQFRIERVEYLNRLGVFSEDTCVYFFAQIKQRCGHNNSEWQRLSGYRDKKDWYVVDWTPFEITGTPFSTEEDANELIESYKILEEKKIRMIPEMNKNLRLYQKYRQDKSKMIQDEIEKNKPKITYKQI